MSNPGQTGQTTKFSSQNVDNLSFDETFNMRVVEMVAYDPAANVLRRVTVNGTGSTESEEDINHEADGSYDYYAFAPPGSYGSLASSIWKVFRVAKSDGIIKTYADGNALYDNVGSGMSLLSYS